MSDRQGGDMELVQDPEEILAQAPAGAEDIADELAAPPRRRLPWLRLLLGAGIVASLAFGGGAWYQKNYGGTSSAATSFPARTGSAAGGFPGGFGGQGGAPGQSGQSGQSGSSATTGTVKLVDGSTIYVTTTDGSVVKVSTSGSTKVTVTKSGKPTDLTPGQSVTVQGTADSSGTVKATTVTQGGSGSTSGGQ